MGVRTQHELDIAFCRRLDNPSAWIRLPGRMVQSRHVDFHFDIVVQDPDPIRILLRTCPAQFEDPDSECVKAYRQVWLKLQDVTKKIISKGVSSGEFKPIDVDSTSMLLVSLLGGVMRQQILGLEPRDKMEKAAVVFCGNALLQNAGDLNGDRP